MFDFNTCVWISLKGHEHFSFYVSPSEINTRVGVWFGVCILFRGVFVLCYDNQGNTSSVGGGECYVCLAHSLQSCGNPELL